MTPLQDGGVDPTSERSDRSPAPRSGAPGDDAIVEFPKGIDTIVWDMGGIFRAYPTEAMARHGREHGWPLDRVAMGPTGEVADPRYDAMSRGDLGEREYLDLVLADLAAAGIDFDPLAQPAAFFPDREVVWTLLREVAALPDRRQAILTNDASRWLGTRWWETWPHRHLFDAILDATEVGVRKPAATPFREVLRRLGDPDPATCVFVDDMAMNTAAARELGMHTVTFDITDPAGSVARIRAVAGLAASVGRDRPTVHALVAASPQPDHRRSPVSSISINPVVTYDLARRAVDAAIAEAEALGVAVVVAVVDPGGHDVAFAAMDGSPLLSRDVARDKGWTAIAFGQPTTWWAEMIAAQPGLAALGGNNRLMPVPGGIPLLVTHDGDRGEGIAGAVGVSGATEEQDEQIATAAVAAIHD